MELIQKRYEEDGTHYFFHSVGKWFLLIKYTNNSAFQTELRYEFSEEQLLHDLPFETAATKAIKDVNGIGKIHYASFLNAKDDEVVLLGIADVTIIARQYPLSVNIRTKPFSHYYNQFQKRYEVNDDPVFINLPEDDVTRIVMMIDDFYDLTDAEYHFGTPLDIEFYQNLSSMGDLIRGGDVGDLIEDFQNFIKDFSDDKSCAEHVIQAGKIIDEMMPYKNGE